MSTLTYKGYIASVSIDFEAGIIHGQVQNTQDVLTFSVKEACQAEAEFRRTIDVYLAWCAEEGEEPERPYSGTVSLRLTSELHKSAAIRAAEAELSLNAWIVRTVECELGRRPLQLTKGDLDRRLGSVRDDVVRVIRTETLIGRSAVDESAPWANYEEGTTIQ